MKCICKFEQPSATNGLEFRLAKDIRRRRHQTTQVSDDAGIQSKAIKVQCYVRDKEYLNMSTEDKPKNPYVVTRDPLGKTIVKSVLFGFLFIPLVIALLLIYPIMSFGRDFGSFHVNWALKHASLPCTGLFAIMSASLFLTKTTNCHFVAALVKTAIGTIFCLAGISSAFTHYHKTAGVPNGHFVAIATLLIAPWGIAFLLFGIHKLARRKPEYLADFGPDAN